MYNIKLNLGPDLNEGLRVRILDLPHRSMSHNSKYRSLVGKEGTIVRVSGTKVGVEVEGVSNEASSYGCFWFDFENLEEINNKEDNKMDKREIKLEGYNKVAMVSVDGSDRTYAYALYDDSIKVSDYVLVTGVAEGKLCFVQEIKDVDDFKDGIYVNQEVMCKVDLSDYMDRVDRRNRKEKLKKEMLERRKLIEASRLDEMYASIDKDYAKMLDELKSIG